MSRRSQQRGFTLVEILVAAAIGLFLTAGMFQMYLSSKQTYRFTEALSRMQESGRYALELIAKDTRMADFWGCSRGVEVASNLNAGCVTPTATDTNAIAGGDGAAGTPDAPDNITLRGAVGTGLIVVADDAALKVGAAREDVEKVLPVDDIALVSDCQGGDLFQVTDLTGGSTPPTVVNIDTPGTGTPGNKDHDLPQDYDETAVVHAWREVQYYIQISTNGSPALFFRENQCAGGSAREVAEGVENMQINYGEDVDGDGTADRYVPAAGVTDMDAVVSVRISLLLASSEDGLADQAQQVTFNGQTFTAGDRRIYQVVTATFAIRNRIL